MKYASYPGQNEYIAMRVMFQYFGKKFADLPELNESMLRWGEANAPEYSCFPLKVYMGFFKEMISRGANEFFVYASTDYRACRYMDLIEGSKKILHDKGYEMNIHYWGGFGTKRLIEQFQEVFGNKSVPKLMLGVLVYTDTLYAVDKINDQANKMRPREVVAGSTDIWLKKWLEKMKKQKKQGQPIKVMNKALKEAKGIELDKNRKILPVVIAGDMFKIHEPFFHFDTIRKINKLGLEAKQPIPFSLLFFGLNPFPYYRSEYRAKYKLYKKIGKKYLQSLPASYVDLTVGEVINEIEHGAKGIIHFQSFGCMPDIMLRPILDRIAKDYNVPIMHFMRDTHASDTAYQTRLEAFSDLIKKKYEN